MSAKQASVRVKKFRKTQKRNNGVINDNVKKHLVYVRARPEAAKMVLKEQHWFREDYNRKKADQAIKASATGSFIIRPSGRDVNNDGSTDYVLVAQLGKKVFMGRITSVERKGKAPKILHRFLEKYEPGTKTLAQCVKELEGKSKKDVLKIFAALKEKHGEDPAEMKGSIWYQFLGTPNTFHSLQDVVLYASENAIAKDSKGRPFKLKTSVKAENYREGVIFHHGYDGSNRHHLINQPWFMPDMDRKSIKVAFKGKQRGHFVLREASKDYNDDGAQDYALAVQMGPEEIWTGQILSHRKNAGSTWYEFGTSAPILCFPSMVDVIMCCTKFTFAKDKKGTPIKLDYNFETGGTLTKRYHKPRPECKSWDVKKMHWYRAKNSYSEARSAVEKSSKGCFIICKGEIVTLNGKKTPGFILVAKGDKRPFTFNLIPTSKSGSKTTYYQFANTPNCFPSLADLVYFGSQYTLSQSSTLKLNTETPAADCSKETRIVYHKGYKVGRIYDALKQDFYKPDFNRSKAEAFLKGKPRGTFVLRPASADQNDDGEPDFSLSVSTPENKKKPFFHGLISSQVMAKDKVWYKFGSDVEICFPNMFDIIACCTMHSFQKSPVLKLLYTIPDYKDPSQLPPGYLPPPGWEDEGEDDDEKQKKVAMAINTALKSLPAYNAPPDFADGDDAKEYAKKVLKAASEALPGYEGPPAWDDEVILVQAKKIQEHIRETLPVYEMPPDFFDDDDDDEENIMASNPFAADASKMSEAAPVPFDEVDLPGYEEPPDFSEDEDEAVLVEKSNTAASKSPAKGAEAPAFNPFEQDLPEYLEPPEFEEDSPEFLPDYVIPPDFSDGGDDW